MVETVVMEAMGMRIQQILLLSIFPLILWGDHCYFIPPKKWQCADPTALSAHVEAGFFTKGKKGFHPSINLAKEKIDISLKEYVQCVKKIHLSDPNTSWRDLGSFKTKAGKGKLTEISVKNQWGNIRMLQLIMINNNTAYILTGACLKEEFSSLRKEMLRSFRSLNVTNDLIGSIPEANVREEVKSRLHQLKAREKKDLISKDWKKLQKTITSKCIDLGPHFQFVLIKELYRSTVHPLLQESAAEKL